MGKRPSFQFYPGDWLRDPAAVKFGVGRYLYRLPAQWCDYDPQKKHFVRQPQLPAWAVPRPRSKEATATATAASKPAVPNRNLSVAADIARLTADLDMTAAEFEAVCHSVGAVAARLNAEQQQLVYGALLALMEARAQEQPVGADPSEVISAEQERALALLIAESRADSQKFCDYYGVANIGELPAASYAEAVGALEKKRKKTAKATA